jgi:hypothetical protein
MVTRATDGLRLSRTPLGAPRGGTAARGAALSAACGAAPAPLDGAPQNAAPPRRGLGSEGERISSGVFLRV